jgi:16S rRNA (guanine(966)-N(2))-methyltransferase RsmD
MVSKRTYRVRVIAGEYKGRWLRYPEDRTVRPTMQRTKSSIFETLKDGLRGRVFVDLFCGAGAMGIEALSRGARFVHFVDTNRAALDFLRRNLDTCGVAPERFHIHAADVFRLLRSGILRDAGAGIVHIDPPYANTDFGLLLELSRRIGYSVPSLIVIEHPRGTDLQTALTVLKTRTFGQTQVSFLEVGE